MFLGFATIFMRKIRVTQILGFVLFAVYITLFITDIFYDYLGNFQMLALSIVLALIGLNLLFKGVILKSGSTMWFALTLLFMAITTLVFEILHLDPIRFYFVYALIPIISSLINLAILKNLFYIKVIILNISLCVPILLDYFSTLSWVYTLLFGGFSVIVGIFICRLVGMKKEKV